MDLRLDEFMAQNEGKYLDWDGIYGAQCTDVCKYWEQKIGSPITHGNGKDYKINADEKPNDYEWVKNTATSVPNKGDIIVWGSGIGTYGHVAIFIRGDVNKFWSFDQNYPLNSSCHVQEHNYNSVIGYLRPKILTTPVETPEDPKDKIISELEKKAQMLEQEIEQLKTDKANLIKGSQDKVTEIELLNKKNEATMKEYDKKITENKDLLEDIKELEGQLAECEAKLKETPTGEQLTLLQTIINWFRNK